MKYWMIVNKTKYDKLVVVADVLKFNGGAALFESNDGELVLALNDVSWSSIQPMTPDQYFASDAPQIRQREKDASNN